MFGKRPVVILPRRAEPFSITIHGNLRSKANSRRLVHIKSPKSGKTIPAFIKSKPAAVFCDRFREQCPVLSPLFEDEVHVLCDIFYDSRRPDLDESLLLDLLQGHVYANDRQVKSKRIRWGLDPFRPRVEVTVRLLESGDRAGDVEGCGRSGST